MTMRWDQQCPTHSLQNCCWAQLKQPQGMGWDWRWFESILSFSRFVVKLMWMHSKGVSSSPKLPILLGMYSLPVHAFPKPESETMWLIVDHFSGKFSPNSMINYKDIAGVQLDGIHSLGASIMQIKEQCPNINLLLYKSNVSAAYCQLPMHPLCHNF